MDGLALGELEKRHLWHPFTQMREWEAKEPQFIERAAGVWLYDRDGNAYYDGNSSMWLNVHGHGEARIDAAVVTQLSRVAHSTLLGLTHAPAALLASRLASIAPAGLARVFYSDNGSTAIEVALKMAYQYWRQQGQERPRFVALSEGYHGDTLGTVSVGGVDRFHGIFKPLLFAVEFVPSPAFARDAAHAADQLEAVLKANAGQVAAVVMEPLVQMAGGVLTAPAGYLARVRALCDRYDTFLILDEVATGFGRTGRMFACEHEGVSPDFLCLGKGLTGGYLPMAATVTTDRVYEGFLGDYAEWRMFTHGHSYTGNPLACAAALASLDIFEEDRVLEGLAAKIETIRVLLGGLLSLRHVGAVRQCGLISGIELVRDKDGNVPYAATEDMGRRVCRRARSLGLITRPLGNVITFVPPLVSTDADLAAMLGIIREAIRQETEDDVRPGE